MNCDLVKLRPGIFGPAEQLVEDDSCSNPSPQTPWVVSVLIVFIRGGISNNHAVGRYAGKRAPTLIII